MEFPEMRAELIGYLESLSDKNYQVECWVKHNCPGSIQADYFDLSVHFLYDDTPLAKDANDSIGYMLHNKQEAESIRLLVEELDKIFDQYGLKLLDEEYIELAEWDNVLTRAKEALFLFRKNDEEFSVSKS